MKLQIAVIPGDGIGPEIVREARKVLHAVGERFGHEFLYTELLMGGASIDVHGVPLTDETIETARASGAVLMGSIGGDAATSPWYKLPPQNRPEAGLLKLRKSLGLFANLRPAVLYQELKGACPLKDEVIGEGFDMMIMRELTGGPMKRLLRRNTVSAATVTPCSSSADKRLYIIISSDDDRSRLIGSEDETRHTCRAI